MKNRSRLIIFIIASVVILGFIYFNVHIVNKGIASTMKALKEDSDQYSSVLPNNYSSFFKKNNQLIFDRSVTSKTKESVSQFRYAHNSLVMIYEIGSFHDLSLKQIITETNNDEHASVGIPYTVVIDNTVYELWRKSGSESKKSHIYLNFYDNKPLVIKKSDSIAYYYDIFKTFSIKYNLNGPKDLFSNMKEGNNDSMPMELMFIKKKNSLYLILLFNGEKDNKPGILASLLN